MRIFSIITALLVCAVIYLAVMERDRMVEFAQSFRSAPEEAATDPAPLQSPTVEEEAEEALPDGTVAVVARHSVAEEVDSSVKLRGRTEAARQVEVRAETSGLIVSEPIRAGAFVEDGQLLCEIAPGTRAAALAEAEARLLEAQARLPEAEAQLPVARARQAEAEANLTAARIDSNAATRLNESGFASETRAATATATVSAAEAAVESAAAQVEAAQAGVQSARSGIRSAEAGLQRAEEELERLQIFAPFEGLLESDTAELGALMQPGSLCATVIQLDPIMLVGFVPEAQVDRIETGAPAGARLATGQEVQGTVTFLSRAADPQTRTFRVEIEVENSDLTIRDGQSAEILVSAPGQMAHLVASSALTLNDDGRLGLRIVDETNTARFAPVTYLRDTADGVLVAGLPDTVDIIVVGQEFVTDGVPVEPHYREAQQ
ncbi:efflux RND transporter periplasmic adaptor subunit [Rhodobacteraceae bacterium W635]|uniref:efflux RND transporter periplasmic adaptor subunit n=1 Tax=Nioella halotolerans TaxID=2303578 RepID=UPI000E3B5DA8|nr:efflux RND transporter periplasmic adaptor subunit [Rhodobacteraceae bacterium W635]